MASKMSWRHHSTDSAPVTVYWFTDEPDWRTGHVRKALGDTVSRHPVNPPATADEITGWAAAATAYVDEVAAAKAELGRTDARTLRWRRTPLVRRWARARFDRATASFVDRVRAATALYQPVRDVIDGRLAEQEVARRRGSEEQRRRRARAWSVAEGRFQAWRRRQAVADRELPGGRTPRQLAADDVTPTAWPPEVVAAVGDVDTWWAGVRASVANTRARESAVRQVVEAITATTAALDDAGRPGIRWIQDEPRDAVEGWWVEFSWSGLPGVQRLKRPPDVPVDHLWRGDWHYDLHLPDRRVLTPGRRGGYEFASVTSTEIGNATRRCSWSTRGVREFADTLFPDRVSYHQPYGYDAEDVAIPMTDHADPADFVPYVEAVAQRAVAAFRALAPE